jgi:SHS2 domain-containing protein
MVNGTSWEHFPHGADIGVRGIGASKADAFAQAALALTAIVIDPRTVDAIEAVEIVCHAPDDELLLVEWLNGVIYEMATRKMLFGRFEAQIDEHKLVAKAWGEAIDLERHDLGVEVKGATCTSLRVFREPSGQWRAQCVIDV